MIEKLDLPEELKSVSISEFKITDKELLIINGPCCMGFASSISIYCDVFCIDIEWSNFFEGY